MSQPYQETDTPPEPATTHNTIIWGHSLPLAKDPHCMRLLLQNTCGLDTKNNFQKLDLISQHMSASQIDIACLTETNVNWKKPHSHQLSNGIIRRHFKHHQLITACSTATAAHSYLPGGTATIITDEWTGCISNSGADPNGLGQWSYVRLKGKNNTRLLVIMTYQVCKSSILATGDSTAFSQQWHLLRASGDETPNPRAQFSNDLANFIANYPNDPIILAGDFNSRLRNPYDDVQLANLIRHFNLKDVLIDAHGPASEIPTRKQGRQIYYVFASKIISAQVSKCGALHYNRMVDPDHWGLFLDLNVDSILGGKPPTLALPALQGIDSTSPKLCKTYLDALHGYLADHQVFKQVTCLEKWTNTHGLTPTLQAKWEAINRDITSGCLQAKRKAQHCNHPPWSKQLHNAHLTVVYCKIVLRALCSGKDPLHQTQFFLLAEPDFAPPDIPNIPLSVAALKLATDTLQEIRQHAKSYWEAFLE
jgi:hypothetical protein